MDTNGPTGTYIPPPPPPPPPGAYVPPPPYGGGGAATPPQEVGTVKIFFIVSLVTNAIASLGWLASVVGIGVATCGIGCLFIVIPAVSIGALVLDAMALQKMNQAPTPAAYSFLKTAAILDIVSGVVTMFVVQLVMGILCLVFLQKPEVQRHYTAPPTTF